MKEKFTSIAAGRKVPYSEIMKELAKLWNTMSAQEKKSYYEKAKQTDKEVPEFEHASFPCPWCDEKFTDKESARSHMKSHVITQNTPHVEREKD